MNVPENGGQPPLSRRSITCPGCGRELFNLQRPQCLWCGELILGGVSQASAATAQSVSPPPEPPPTMPLYNQPLPGASLMPSAFFRPRVRVSQDFFRSPGGWVVIGLIVYPFIMLFYHLWQMMHLINSMPTPPH